MKWFEGSINEAVATSKSRKAIFVVFIEGKDDASAEAAKTINGTEVSRRLERDEFVAIRLESGSETYRFFAEIYQLVPVPSLFFIGENGAPLEIIADSTTEADLAKKIDLVLSKAGKTADVSQNLIHAEQKASNVSNTASTSNKVDEDEKKESLIVPEEPLPQTASKNESNNVKNESNNVQNDSNNIIANNVVEEESTNLKTTESPAPTKEEKDTTKKELTAEEKLERARQLIEQQRKQRIEEEERKAREREIERRKEGRNLQKMRQKQQDMEIRQAYEEKMREKAADAAAREKVLQQILQDKLERKQRELSMQQQAPQQQASQQQAAESSEVVKPSVSATAISRIQFRLPSGNPYIAQFELTSTLRDLRNYVVENINPPFRQFAMSTSFPRQELTHEDDNKTLSELQLVPTAVILILPVTNPNTTTTVTTTQDVGIISRVLWSTFAVFSTVYYYVLDYFTGGRRNNPPKRKPTAADSTDPGNSTEGAVTSSVQNSATTSGLGRRYLGNRGSTTIKAEGNIHRLHSGGDDSDDNNTWNGNSTQQM